MKKFAVILLVVLASCDLSQNNNVDRMKAQAARSKTGTPFTRQDTQPTALTLNRDTGAQYINTGNTAPAQLMLFAETQQGVPYSYGGSNPKTGFDCSGFITYVFNHFNITVPRSSVEFSGVGKTIPVSQAKRGDIILFTGTDSADGSVGHMGLVTANLNGTIYFIHSTSGRQMGVTITPLEAYYKSRFVRIARIFPQNG